MLRARILVGGVAILCGGLLLGACGGDKTETPAAPTVHPTTSPSTALARGDTTIPPSAHVLQFDAPTDVACAGPTATITVTYATVDLTAVAFVVDGSPAGRDGSGPPTSGEYPVVLPCDGNVHTIQLIGSGPSGPAFASKAVVTRST